MGMTEYNTSLKSYRKLTPTDADFRFTDGITVVSRAGIEIAKDCPSNIVQHIEWAVAMGYVRPIAFIPDRELTWEKLQS